MSKHVAAYVEDEQHERWKEQAEEMDMSMSQWTQAMVEAGMKKFDRDVEPDESRDDLRRKRNDLRDELQRARDRIAELEQQVHTNERDALIEYVEENPGSRYPDIVQHIANSAGSRVTKLLDQLEGEEIEIDEEGRVYVR